MSDRTEIEVPATGLLPETPVEDHASEGRAVNPRDAMMARIAEKVAAAREAELGHTGGEEPGLEELIAANEATRPLSLGEVEEDRAPRVEADSEPDRLPVIQTAVDRTGSPPSAVSAPVPTQTFAIDVNGQTLHVTQEQMAHLARMGAVANQAIHQYQTQQQYQQPAPAPMPVQEQPRAYVDEERLKQTVKAIQYGDEAAAATALGDLVNHVVSGVPQPQQVDTRAMTQEALRAFQFQQDKQVINQEYSEIISDPDLQHLAALKVVQIEQRNRALGQYQSPLDVYREAGNIVLEKMGKSRPGQQVDESTAPQAPNMVVRRAADLDARKRAAPRAMSQVIDRRSPAPQVPRAPTASDIIEGIRKARGQTSMR